MVYENKDLGLVVAENEDEVFYNEIVQNTKEDIKKLEKLLKFNNDVLEMAQSKLLPK